MAAPGGDRDFYLLKGGQHSCLHRLKSDELWHFHLGSALTSIAWAGGKVTSRRTGRQSAAGQHLQIAVRAGCWFGATVDDPAGFSLLGCTVAPGFDFADLNWPTALHSSISIPTCRADRTAHLNREENPMTFSIVASTRPTAIWA